MYNPFLFLLAQEDSVGDNGNVAINMNTQIKLDNVVLLYDYIYIIQIVSQQLFFEFFRV